MLSRTTRTWKSSLPFVLVNVAMTADGKITTANRKVEAFGSPRDREHMLELRAEVDAVMAGARTVDLNPITMGPVGSATGGNVCAMAWQNTICVSSSAGPAHWIQTRRSSSGSSRRLSS